jgi:hypothetical protein
MKRTALIGLSVCLTFSILLAPSRAQVQEPAENRRRCCRVASPAAFAFDCHGSAHHRAPGR